MKHPIAVFAALCMASSLLLAQTDRVMFREFFVSPTGSDTNDGTSDKPFQTLERARHAVRAAIPGMTGDIAVTIRGGNYPVSSAIVFKPEDSALSDHRIIYRAAKGETPVFTGGVPVTGWTPYKDGIWKAALDRGEKLRTLYVNGTRAVMANTGKKIHAQGGWGTYKVTAGQAPWAWQSGQAADGIQYNIADLPTITRNVTDLEIENQTTWNKNFVGVREIVTEGDKYIFKLQQPYGAIAQQVGWGAGLTPNSDQIIHNAFELLDEPGEFYFDRAEKMVYYIPRPGENMETAEVVAPVTQTLVQIEGQPIKNRVRNITFEGLTFAYTDYNLLVVGDSHGMATVQAACVNTAFANSNWHLDLYRGYDVLPGAIVANGIEGIDFIRNTIAHTGCQGIVMSNDINDVRVVGNVIRDSGGSAITLGHPQHIYENDTIDLKHAQGAGIEHEKFSAGTESVPRRVLISNNFLPDNAALFNGHTVITVFFANQATIEHNWIPNAPYSGMNVGWGWCDFDGSEVDNHPQWGKGSRPSVLPGKPTTVAGSNRIHANRVERTMSILHDGGGIYTLGRQPDTLIDRNYIRSSERSLYNDEGSAFITSRSNVIQSPYAVAHFAPDFGRKHDLTSEGNFATEDKWDLSSPGTKGVNNTICEPGAWPAEAQAIINESGLEPAWKYIIPADWQPAPVELEGVDLAWAGNAIDFVLPGTYSDDSHLVSQHNSRTGKAHDKTYREGDEFAYRIKVPVGKKSVLVATYWGEEEQNRIFGIFIDDQLLAIQNLFREHPGTFFEQEYPITPELLPQKVDGDNVEVVVRFTVEPNGFTAGGLFGLKVVPAN
ncbi:MAG: hypothetical protein NTV93_20050 [Verrucomicrobia bacterium]|nr:hypothetical protein [Verrucomicrobiota bacterium]